ncbi:MAG: hypothetical protein K2I67_01490, partial [Malacoplasma sp.]|nr:hypothetical protein [Malacoplasma sp.]
MKRFFLNYWKIISTILFNHGLLNGFFSYGTIEKEIKKQKLDLSEANLNLYIASIHIMINLFYFWIVALLSISDIFYEFLKESPLPYQIRNTDDFKSFDFFKPSNKIVSRWYTPKYEGMILNLIINNNNYILPNA